MLRSFLLGTAKRKIVVNGQNEKRMDRNGPRPNETELS